MRVLPSLPIWTPLAGLDDDDPIVELTDTLNELAGYPLCGAACTHNGACTLDNGHAGDHEARGVRGKNRDYLFCRWPQ
jgi:hypothetical protein